MAKKQQPTGENNFNNWSYDASFDNEARDTRIGDAIADAFSSDNPYMALLDIATMGTFGGVGGKGMVKNFLTKSAKGRKLVEKLPFLAKLTEKIVSPKNKGFDFNKAKEFNKTVQSEIKAKGLVADGVGGSSKGEFMVGGNRVKFDTSHKNLQYDIRGGSGPAEDITKITNAKGVDLDNFVSKLDGPTNYSKSVTKLPSRLPNGTASTRDFVKVDLPNGESQIFYRSTGTGGKAGSKGEWIPFEGHRKSDNWFIKTGSRGKFHGKDVKTIFTYKDGAGDVISKSDWVKRGSNQDLVETTGVYEQVKKLGLDPWKEIQKGNLKLDHYGQGFKYGSKEYVKIAEQLKAMNL
tara:strand:+ start:133 stop:1179 length:1047 start_codon:yes stop_codon:yes gene_type:complete